MDQKFSYFQNDQKSFNLVYYTQDSDENYPPHIILKSFKEGSLFDYTYFDDITLTPTPSGHPDFF